jgi:hypothetical protein
MIARSLASAAVAAGLAWPAAAQQQPRERRQDRRAQPSRPEPSRPEPTATMLFERADVPYRVLHAAAGDAETCHAMMADKPAKIAFMIETNAGDRTFVIVQNSSDPLPAPFTGPGARLDLRVEVAGVARSYGIVTRRPSKADGSGWAEAPVPRAALRHLQAAVNSRSGFVVKAGDAEPIRFSVPPRAADAFDECGRGILRGRLDGAMDRLNRSMGSAPSR